MQSKAAAATLMSLLLATPVIPQGKLVEMIEVRVANVDVVVRDRAGNPVTGLTRDDFDLYENGLKQPISNFYEVRRDAVTAQLTQAEGTPSSAVPLQLRQRRLLLFVDSASLRPATKKQVLAAAEKFVDRMQAEDQAMVVTWKLGVHVVTPFTNDKTVLKRGLADLQHFAPAGVSSSTAIVHLKAYMQQLIDIVLTSPANAPGRMTFADAYDMSLRQVDTYSEQLLREQDGMLEALDRTIANLAGLDGKKVLLFVGAQLPQRPGAEMYRYAYDQFAPHMNRSTRPGAGGPAPAVLDLQALNGPPGSARPRHIEDLSKRASANGVTIYAVDAGQIESELSASESQVAVDYGEGFSRKANTASSMEVMAAVTGGVAITQTSNYDLAFDTIAKDLDSYYSLGYRPGEERNTTARRITVKTKNPAYSVRSRESFILKTTDDEMNDKVIANLFTDASVSTWPIAVRLGTAKNEGGKFLVPVQVVMKSSITLLPQEQNLVGGFTLFFVVGSPDGKASEVMRRPAELKIPPSAEPLVRAKPITFSTAVRVNAGESVLSVAVLDQISGATGYTRAKIVAH